MGSVSPDLVRSTLSHCHIVTEMGVRVFLTTNSGNKEIEMRQQTILQVLRTRQIEHDTIDISAPGNQDLRKFMREKGKKIDGQRNALPPQIFNGEEHRGDFEDFDIANEDDNLEEFLGIPRKNPKAAPVKTGAVAPEVGRFEPGKLDIKVDKKSDNDKKKINDGEDNNEDVNTNNGSNSSGSNEGDIEDQNSQDIDPGESVNGDTETDSGYKDDSDSVENKSDDGDFEHSIKDEADEAEAKDSHSSEDVNAGNQEVGESRDDGEEDDDAKNKGLIIDNDDGLDTQDYDDDSSDFTSDEEDNVVEFMPDGEIVRKKSRGFKQLNNCKRFWKASLMLDKV